VRNLKPEETPHARHIDARQHDATARSLHSALGQIQVLDADVTEAGGRLIHPGWPNPPLATPRSSEAQVLPRRHLDGAEFPAEHFGQEAPSGAEVPGRELDERQ
jgi:hypothetical protein